MTTKNVIALALAAALGVSMSAAYADYDHSGGRDYRNDHRDSREYRRDGRDEHRDYRRDRYEHERHDQYVRRDYGPHGYAVARPIYMPPPVIYAPPMPTSLDIVVPLQF